MIPPITRFLEGYIFLARRLGLTLGPTFGELREALDEATRLARHPHDEPAALFYVLARRPLEMGDGWILMPGIFAGNQAQSLALSLHAGSADLDDLRWAIARDRLAFEDVRAWFAERLKPIASEP